MISKKVKKLMNSGSDDKIRRGGDKLLLFCVIILSLIGLVAVYSASSYSAQVSYGDKFFFLKKHFIGVLMGLGALAFGCFFSVEKIQKISVISMVISIVLLALVFTPIGFENYGAKRWIKIGGLTLQPSEIAKLTYILFTANYFAKDPSRSKSFKGILPVVLVGVIICGLIIIEPNMSITMCFGMLMVALLFISGVKYKSLIIILAPVALSVPLLIVAEPYRLSRFSAFLNPWSSPKGEGYQLLQSLYALGSGGWFGVGLFNSRQKFRFLPFSESDFILAVIGEEVGFIGLTALFALIFLIVYRCIKIGANSKNFFGFAFSVGVGAVFGIQSLLNALVVTGSIPPTGLPLPLISAGNTSLMVFLFAFGVVYNISKQSNK